MQNVDFARAYDFMRQRILSREFLPGKPLMPDVLAKKIGTSRTPIRDALRQLNADGLVTIRPRIGATVREISMGEYSELCGLRMALEIFAAGLAAQMRTAADLEEIRAAHDAARNEIERLVGVVEREHPGYVEYSGVLMREDIRFHLAITTAARNSEIKKEILRHQLISRLIIGGHYFDLERPSPQTKEEAVSLARATGDEHREIYEAIKQGSPSGAKDAMEHHLREDAATVLHRMARVENRQLAGELGSGDDYFARPHRK